jgi:hypothetical protein
MIYTKILLFAAFMLSPSMNAHLLFDCNVFTIDNESSYDLGEIAVSGLGGTGGLDVTATGEYSDTLCFTPLSILVDGHASIYPDTTIVTLTSGNEIQIVWISSQLVGITNKELQGRPR